MYLYGLDTDAFKCKSFFLEMFTTTVKAFLLFMPFILIIIIRDAVPLVTVLTFLPAQLLFLITFFIWLTATEIDPEMERKPFKWWLINGIVGATCFLISMSIIAILSYIFSWNLTDPIFWCLSLTLGTVFSIIYFSFILRRALRKAKQRSKEEESIKEN